MNSIDRIGKNVPISTVSPKTVHRDLPQPSSPAVSADTVEISGRQPLKQAFKAGEIRHDKVASLRKQIESGNYNEESKIDAVVDKLLNRPDFNQ
jgi:anti-sigma28 factor (negative regulator of flagellin synthesis)